MFPRSSKKKNEFQERLLSSGARETVESQTLTFGPSSGSSLKRRPYRMERVGKFALLPLGGTKVRVLDTVFSSHNLLHLLTRRVSSSPT